MTTEQAIDLMKPDGENWPLHKYAIYVNDTRECQGRWFKYLSLDGDCVWNSGASTDCYIEPELILTDTQVFLWVQYCEWIYGAYRRRAYKWILDTNSKKKKEKDIAKTLITSVWN